jgi:predicted TIM-barrel fold metal-dependent hydrolase
MSDQSNYIDACVHPFMRSNWEIREYIAPSFRTRGIPDVEVPWYQAPGGDYAEDLYADDVYPASDPEVVSRHLFEERGAEIAILNPLTRGNLPDYLLNSAICSATNDWLAERWLTDGNGHGRYRGTIRVNPEDVDGAVAEIKRWADHPLMVQVGIPLQSREPYGKPMFLPIWEVAAEHGLPVAVHLTGGAGIEFAPTPAGHVRTYAHYIAYTPLNYFHHLSTLLIEGVFERLPNLFFVFADGGSDILTPLIWRLDTFWRAFRDQTPWVARPPSDYLREHVRFCFSKLEGPPEEPFVSEWFDQMDKADLLLFSSNYPYWSLAEAGDLPAGLRDDQREKILRGNANDLYKLNLFATA